MEKKTQEICYRLQQPLSYWWIFCLYRLWRPSFLVLVVITLKCYRRINEACYWLSQSDFINFGLMWLLAGKRKLAKLTAPQDENLMNKKKLNLGIPRPADTCER